MAKIKSRTKDAIWRALRPVIAASVGLLVGVAFTAIAGEQPWNVLRVIIKGAFGSTYDLGLTLFYTTPIILTGLAVALPIKAGLFNIGAEGQLNLGALAVAAVGILCPQVPQPWNIVLAVTAGFAAGAFWGSIPGWLKAYRGSHEVITTIMLNFIAAGLTGWAVLALLPSLDSQNPESARIAPSYVLQHFSWFGDAPVTWALPMAVAAAVLVWVLFRFTIPGFKLTASGLSPEAAQVSGISVRYQQWLALTLGGGLAGLVGVAEVMGNSGRFRIGFSPDYGFIGIPVALLARAHPLGLVFSALLFGALQKGTAELDLETTYVTRDLAAMIQAMVVLAVSAEGGLTLWRRHRLAVKPNKPNKPNKPTRVKD